MAKFKLHDVARKAGVSVATVDRVLNRRPGVRAKTIARMEDAVRRLNCQPDRLAARLARTRECRLRFVLPVGTNTFMQNLNDEIVVHAERMAQERVTISVVRSDVVDGQERIRIDDFLRDNLPRQPMAVSLRNNNRLGGREP